MSICETRDSVFSLQQCLKRGSKGLLFAILLLSLLCCVTPVSLEAQFYEYGQDAGSIRWNQFSSEHYHLIYPRGLDSLAFQCADKLEYFFPFQAQALDHKHSRMPVIIHNEASFSNGVFVWAPKRIEIFTNPDPNSYPQDWLTQLALHEGRHAFQVSKLNQGFAKGLSFIGGEQAVGAITGFLPMWYLEGDAVDAETRFSMTGRGRMPSFEMRMKAMLLEKKRYSFSKAFFGSYKDQVPNHYELGYLMVRHGRRQYGDKFWTDLEDYASRKPYLIAPSYFSMKKYGVTSKTKFYNAALDEYLDHWTKTHKERSLTSQKTINNAQKKGYTNYRFPTWISDSTLLVLKTGIDQIPELIAMDLQGKEKRLFRPGYLNSGKFSTHGNIVIWDEWVPDIRWTNRNYSVIRKLDMNTGNVTNLGVRTRYYAPDLSAENGLIAAVEQRTDQSFYLVILDQDGRLLSSLSSPGKHYMQHPVWDQDSGIYVTLNKTDGEYLYRYSLAEKQWEKIFHAGFDDISNPVIDGSRIFFSGTFSGIDNIYCLDRSSDSLYKVTSSEFGAFEPSVSSSGKQIAYSDYHAHGYDLAVADLKEMNWIAIDDLEDRVEQLDFLPEEFELEIIEGLEKSEPGSYVPTPYNKMLNSLRLHSWLPAYFDYLNPEAAISAGEFPVNPGVTLLSQNLLSTVVGMLGYEYRDKMHFLHTGATLKGKIPVIDFRLDAGGQPNVFEVESRNAPPLRSDRIQFTSSVYVPLRFKTGKYITFMQPQLAWNYSSDYFFNPDVGSYERGSHRFNYRNYFTSYLRRGVKDILPRFGIALNYLYKHAPFDKHNLGSMYAYSASLYLPGVLKHQTLKVRYGRQVQDPLRYLYGNGISFVRGMPGLAGFDMKIYSADYTFPLLYPDLSIEPLIYIKRIRANVWGDYLLGVDMLTGDADNPLEDQVHYSLGIDLLTDFHPIRMFFPFAIGLRSAYLPGTGDWDFEFLFNIDI